MVSWQARLFYRAMQLFFPRMMPPNLALADYRRAAQQPFAEPMPRAIQWKATTINGISGEWITPLNSSDGRVVLYLHGGGYVLYTPQTHRVLVGRLAQATGCAAFMIDYRLAPEHPFPAALDDAQAAYAGLLAQGYAPSQIALAGDSAGGGLAAALLLRLRDAGMALPAAAYLMSALLDCTLTDPRMTALQPSDPILRVSDLIMMTGHYRGALPADHPLISPLLADLHGLPPLLVEVGEHEVLHWQSVDFAARAQAAGVNAVLKVCPGMIHVFPLFANMVPEGQTALNEGGAFLRGHFANSEQRAGG
jgi:epsilon-lactone hydrolase